MHPGLPDEELIPQFLLRESFSELVVSDAARVRCGPERQGVLGGPVEVAVPLGSRSRPGGWPGTRSLRKAFTGFGSRYSEERQLHQSEGA
jgi:hypothetical protein